MVFVAFDFIGFEVAVDVCPFSFLPFIGVDGCVWIKI